MCVCRMHVCQLTFDTHAEAIQWRKDKLEIQAAETIGHLCAKM